MPYHCPYRTCASIVLLGLGWSAMPHDPATAADTTTQQPMAGMGMMVGEVTSTSALAQVRLTATDQLVDGDLPGTSGFVEFSLYEISGPESAPRPVEKSKQLIEAKGDRDFITRANFANLTPGTRYLCKSRIGLHPDSLRQGPQARFQTHPGGSVSATVRFVVVTGMNYAKFHGDDRIDRKQHLIENNTELPKPYAGPDKHLGYPALQAILAKKPHFFVGTGDNVYYDTPDNPRAETIPQMRQKWHEQFVQPRYLDLFAAVPTYWEVDDHDYRVDDGDNTGDYRPSPKVGRQILLEQLPIAPAEAMDEAKTYRTHRVSRDLQIWLTENRMYRSPNKMADGPAKSIWGTAQKAWLKRTLEESDAAFKILISPTPMVGPDDLRKTDNHTNIGGFRHERDEFFKWVQQTGLKGFYIMCGDRHWQYHSIHPLGIEEFSCGALVDANSRPARRPGDPKSTDPQATIKQPYYQNPPSGGFLLVRVDPGTGDQAATLTFQFHDERGRLLHEHKKARHR